MKKNKDFFKGALVGALAVLLVVGLILWGPGKTASGIFGNKQSGPYKNPKQKMEFLDKLIEEFYIGDVDEDAQLDGIYKGYIQALGDRYSIYFDEEETKEFLEGTSGKYSGVGAVLSQNPETGLITVVHVYKDSPADEAGIKDNDILYKVNGDEVVGKDLSEVVNHIRGEEGSTVDIVVLRGEMAEEIETTATRRVVNVETVAYEMLEGNIGYIAVSEFDDVDVTYEQYKAAMEDLEKQGMVGLVVDLRGNPGGNLMTVAQMVDLMLPEGNIVTIKTKDGQEKPFDSDEEHKFTKPLAVLVNGHSASASEIYSGAIQDSGVGTIVGTQTYGKGIVQRTFDLQDGTMLQLTIAEYFTPSGRNIHGEGITPDVVIPYEPDESNPEYDNQLEKALEIVRGK